MPVNSMHGKLFILSATLMLVALFRPQPALAAETAAIVSVKAQHYEHDYWEPWNPGLSFEFRQDTSGPLDASLSLGSVRDSLGNWSPHAGLGLHKSMGDWSVGINTTLLYRQQTLDGGDGGWRIAPLPSLDWRVDEAYGIGLIFIPAPTKHEQDSAAMLLQLRLLL